MDAEETGELRSIGSIFELNAVVSPFSKLRQVVGDRDFECAGAVFLQPLAEFFDGLRIGVANGVENPAAILLRAAFLIGSAFGPCFVVFVAAAFQTATPSEFHRVFIRQFSLPVNPRSLLRTQAIAFRKLATGSTCDARVSRFALFGKVAKNQTARR